MDDGLTHEASAFLNFRHYARDPKEHGFRWVDVKHLHGAARSLPPRDEELLASLIAHEQFRDDYAGGGVDPDGIRHGPYWLRLITPDAYEPVSRETAARILAEWVDPQWDPPAALRDDLRREVFDRLAAADAVHHLVEFGDEALHDWGGVHGEFHEFVLVDRAAARVTLLVAADD
ncbi:hypothetical protein [Streptomyces xanthii]|uniref:Uncharacterized protein n=1 Tax=Streptomyces xanthii TaxID=2768069 RepID=A0A7H1BG30_9ACTN|nr:hypothetical protein [Streptomyces xanthii]QNS07685.1 hypothetical protein IAG42_31495 [Streptomyces xanthii]